MPVHRRAILEGSANPVWCQGIIVFLPTIAWSTIVLQWDHPPAEVERGSFSSLGPAFSLWDRLSSRSPQATRRGEKAGPTQEAGPANAGELETRYWQLEIGTRAERWDEQEPMGLQVRSASPAVISPSVSMPAGLTGEPHSGQQSDGQRRSEYPQLSHCPRIIRTARRIGPRMTQTTGHNARIA